MISHQKLIDLLNYDKETGVFRWCVGARRANAKGNIAGCVNARGYRYISVLGKKYKASRLAWMYVFGSWPELSIDHINGNKSDDRIANLRMATVSQNNENRRLPSSNNSSGFLGVYFQKDKGSFRASIRVDGKYKHIGSFKTPEVAHEAYLQEKRQLHSFCTI